MSARSSRLVCLLAGLVLFGAAPPDTPADRSQEQAREQAEDERLEPQVDIEALATAPPAVQPPSIQAPSLPGKPAAGMGRLRIDVGGTRRWCTFPDDRVVKPPVKQTGPASRNPVYTFGYMFTVAAVNRARPSETLLLFESPIIRTAVLRQAAKLGRAKAAPSNRPPMLGDADGKVSAREKQDPSALVPFWQEDYRCTTLPEAFDFDVAPGTYDLYLAFDILLRSGSWAHRTIGFATDVTVGEGGAVRLQATAGMQAGGRRELSIAGPAPESSPTGAH